MGRKSREKRERSKRRTSGLAGALRALDARSVESLLEAAAASPTANHCLPSIAHTFGTLMKHGSPEGRRSTPEDLPILVNLARDADPRIAQLEDYHPYDTTLTVCARWDTELYRILPGELSRPVAAVQEARLVASCIDPVLVRHLGYGLADVVELILRRVDHVATTLAPVWMSGQAPNPGDLPSITSDEINATVGLQDIMAQVAACTNPERTLRALENHSSPRNKMSTVQTSQFQAASFGTSLAVRFGTNNYRPIPAGLMMETIPALTSDLAAKAQQQARSVTGYWNTTVFKTVDRALRGSGHSVIPVHNSQDRPVGFVVSYSAQQVLLIGLTASLIGDKLQQALDSHQKALSADRNIAKLQEQFRIPPDAEIEALQIVACPETPLLLAAKSRGVPSMTLQDLLWICRSTSRSQVDLWHYVRTRRNEPMRLFVWDEINAWEWWTRNDKSFHAGGTDMASMFIAPNFAEAEWVWAAGMFSTERALLALNLPSVADWPIVDDIGADVQVVDLDEGEMVRVLRWRVPTGFRINRASRGSQDVKLLDNLIGGVAFRLAGMKDIYERLFSQAGVASLMVTFRYDPDGTAPLTTPAKNTLGTLEVVWSDTLGDAVSNSPEDVEKQVGEILAEALPIRKLRREFLREWRQGAPCVRRDAIFFEQKTVHNADPIMVDAVYRSEASRRLAEHLSGSSEVSTGKYSGDEAKTLENDKIYPWLVKHLRDDLQRYDTEKMLEYALGQMELLNCKRRVDEEQFALRLGFSERSPAADRSADEERKEIILLTRCVHLIVEQLLSLPAKPGQQPSDLRWGRTLGIATLCIESCFRSDAIYRGLIDTTTTISESYVVDTESGAASGDIDLVRYTAAVLQATRPEPVHLRASAPSVDSETYQPRGIAETLPKTRPTDIALKEMLGFGLDALIGCYECATQWELPPKQIVGSTNRDTFVQAAHDTNPQIAREEYQAALEWLELESIDAVDIKPWAIEDRAERIATRPFVVRGDDLLILPWSADMALRVLYTYLGDGRLPWPTSMMDRSNTSGTKGVSSALNDYRQSLNQELEQQCTQTLEAHTSLKVRSNIEHTKRSQYGIANLRGEVDVLCLDVDSATIWVIEVKDPSEPFSQRRIGNIVANFNKPDGYVDKLLGKTSDIQASASTVVKTLAPDHQHRDWQTRPLIVTRNVCPAAFVNEPRVAFCTLSDIPEAILDAAAIARPRQ